MKILATYLAGLIGGGVLGGIGLVLGTVIGGNIGFPEFGGAAAGYEAGGLLRAHRHAIWRSGRRNASAKGAKRNGEDICSAGDNCRDTYVGTRNSAL